MLVPDLRPLRLYPATRSTSRLFGNRQHARRPPCSTVPGVDTEAPPADIGAVATVQQQRWCEAAVAAEQLAAAMNDGADLQGGSRRTDNWPWVQSSELSHNADEMRLRLEDIICDAMDEFPPVADRGPAATTIIGVVGGVAAAEGDDAAPVPTVAPPPSESDDTDLASIHDYTCPICLELLLRPVKLSCGHRFCRGCWVRVLRSREVRASAPPPTSPPPSPSPTPSPSPPPTPSPSHSHPHPLTLT